MPPRKVARISAARALFIAPLAGTAPTAFSGPPTGATALLNTHHFAADDRERQREELVLAAAGLDLDRIDVHAQPAGRAATEVRDRQWLHVLRLLRRVLLIKRARDNISGRSELREAVGLTLQQRHHVFVRIARFAATAEDPRVR